VFFVVIRQLKKRSFETSIAEKCLLTETSDSVSRSRKLPTLISAKQLLNPMHYHHAPEDYSNIPKPSDQSSGLVLNIESLLKKPCHTNPCLILDDEKSSTDKPSSDKSDSIA
jgi:hypothetical protein